MKIEEPFNLSTVGLAKMDWERREGKNAVRVDVAADVCQAIEESLRFLFDGVPARISGEMRSAGMDWHLDGSLPNGWVHFS